TSRRSIVASGSAAEGLPQRKPRVPTVRFAIGRGVFLIPPLGVVLLLLLGPVVLLALYSLNLRTNIPGTPTGLSFDNWSDFLFRAGNPFRGRFYYSMVITLLVSIGTTVAAYPLAYYLA